MKALPPAPRTTTLNHLLFCIRSTSSTYVVVIHPVPSPFICFFFGPDQDALAYPAHHLVLETTSQNQGSALEFSSMIIPQMTAVAVLYPWCPVLYPKHPVLQP